MTNKEKLIEIVKADGVVKKDMEELKFGCYIKHNSWHIFQVWDSVDEKQRIRKDIAMWLAKIIWTLQERHLRMYCKNKKISLDIIESWYIDVNNKLNVVQLDNTKDFDNQSEEVYWQIVKFLENNL